MRWAKIKNLSWTVSHLIWFIQSCSDEGYPMLRNYGEFQA
jgi:hypothetical protein